MVGRASVLRLVERENPSLHDQADGEHEEERQHVVDVRCGRSSRFRPTRERILAAWKWLDGGEGWVELPLALGQLHGVIFFWCEDLVLPINITGFLCA